MFIIRLIRYLKGYVQFSVTGAFVERFLNLTIRSGINIWDGKKTKDTFMGYTLVKNYKKFPPYAKKTGVRLHVLQRYGAPFKAKKYRKRKGLLLGLIGFAVVLMAMSMFMWEVDVVGNTSIPTEEIITRLEELGVHKGKLLSSINPRDVEEKMRLSFENLSWITINLRGSTATVEVKERVMPPERIDNDNIPCNVIASVGGKIVSMDVYEGQAMVMVGDVVLQGDIIVSGIVEDKSGNTYLKQASALVIAQTTEKYIQEIALQEKVKIPTGEVIDKKFLCAGDSLIPLSFWGEYEGECTTEDNVYPIKLFNFTLPINLLNRRVLPLEEVLLSRTPKQAKELALQELALFEQELASRATIESKEAKGMITKNKYILQAEFLCQQNIGIQKEILRDISTTIPPVASK